MITRSEVPVTEERIVSVTCDKCDKILTPEDSVEWNEGHMFEVVGGYGSVFGDGMVLSFDLCQNCLYELVKPFARVIPQE